MDKEYILYCDESEKTGRYYSNFYGGVLVGTSQYQRIALMLQEEKSKLNLLGEVKWAKVTEAYLDKYRALLRAFFAEVRAGHLKVRIMFRQNAHEPDGLSEEVQRNSYFMLYYQFIKHAYGFGHANLVHKPVRLRLYFDQFPENREAASRFKGFLLGLNKNTEIQGSGILLKEEDITEISSHDHVLLQCLDIVLGAINFRLNNKHKEKLPDGLKRGKRTIAKEKLYRLILNEIKGLKPEFKNFNIGMSTLSSAADKWREPYLHWSFVPRNKIYRHELTKGKNKKPQPAYITSDA
jgi:Protein of unknown function (DUF3800)